MSRVRTLAAALIAWSLAGCAADTAAPRTPAALEIVSGVGQAGTVGASLGTAIVVRAVDAERRPVSHVALVWSASADGAVHGAAYTDSSGTARATWTLGTVAEPESLVVRFAGDAATRAAGEAVVVARVVADVAAAIQPMSGDSQSGVVGAALASPLVVRVVDRFGNAAPGAGVRWEPDGGSVVDASPASDTLGGASARWVLPTTAGARMLVARLADTTGAMLPIARFSSTALPGAPARLAIVSGDGQSGPFGTLLPAPLNVRVFDQYGNTVPGAIVQVTSDHGDPGVTQTKSDSTGVASLHLRLPADVGAVSVTFAVGALSATLHATSVPARFASVTAGNAHICALTVEGYAYCWGIDASLEIGVGDSAWPRYYTRPTAVRTDQRFTSIAPGNASTCAVALDARLWCWGTSDDGFGYPESATGLPYLVDPTLRFTSVSIGSTQKCAIATDGQLYCWGGNYTGEAGSQLPCCTAIAHPRLIDAGMKFTAVSAGMFFTCGITTEGLAYCWGADDHGQLGSAVTSTCPVGPTPKSCSPTRVLVSQSVRFTAIAAGQGHACAVAIGGTVYCWGFNDGHLLGTSSAGAVLGATPVATTAMFTTVSASTGYSCGLDASSFAECWGATANKWLGLDGFSCPSYVDPTATVWCSPPPRRLPVNMNFRQFTTDNYSSCGIATDDVLYCWGWNIAGEVGDGTGVDRTTPTKVLGQP